MATKEEVLQIIDANKTVSLAKIADVRTAVQTLIDQGTGGGTGAADLEAVANALSTSQEEVSTKLQEVRNLLPGAE